MAAATVAIDVKVRDLSGAYVTGTVRGRRCSCTHSAQEAAKRLGEKIFGEGFLRVEELARLEAGASMWRIHGEEVA
ncbi:MULTISPECIES: hypothetical protein [unclassified Variovorax]|jgi:hypothetical protein|uniref:hypothetical protein n=1 Tax=unclassified Variovorax TaxID=663243 RepID=UPI000F7F3BA9|nr:MULTISPECIES: hypothetical protein [unclassified Variovorax]RSZ35106.1 hypothetical protein EJO70_24860 [Variovorax sp. 553]RSZ35876.1 hypothetical protein EJO71_25630 [Variovorax sp. 679]